ncbi:MAG TPA: hypothetical protein VIN57_01350 [Magnetovibrio sp.]
MIQNIIILQQVILTERHMTSIGIEALSRDFTITVLDLTAWYKPDVWRKHGHSHHVIPGYRSIDSMDALVEALKDIDQAVVFDYLLSPPHTAKVRKYLAERKFIRALFSTGQLPDAVRVSTSQRLRALISPNLPKKILAKIRRFVGQQDQEPDPIPDMVVFAGEIGCTEELAKVKHIVWAHSVEYNQYMALDAERKQTEPYAVYLDQALLHHPDYAYANEKILLSEETFFTPLNAFFAKFEQASGMKVKFAAHPRSEYERHPHLLDGRELHKGETAELIRDSALVLAHSSTAIVFATLWKKPLVFLTTSELARTEVGLRIPNFASYLNAPVINLPHTQPISASDVRRWLTPDEAACETFNRLFTKKPGTPKKDVWEIVSSYIRENL